MNDSNHAFRFAAQLHDFVEAVAVPCALHAGEQLIAANTAMGRLCGRSPGMLLSMSFEALLRPSDREAVARVSQACLDDGRAPPAVSVAVLTPQGGARPVEIHARPVVMAGKNLVMLTCVDQSDVLHVQSSLIGMSEMLRQIVDGAPIASFVIDQNHTVTHWNSACENMTGLMRQQVLGTQGAWRAFYENERPVLAHFIVDGADPQAVSALYAGTLRPSRAVTGGFEAEAFFPQFGDHGAWLFITAAPLRNAAGEIVGAIETLQDVTERRRAVEALHVHRAELESLVHARTIELEATARELERFVAAAPYGVAFTWGGKVQRVNDAMAAIFGYTPAEMIGMGGRELYLSDQDYADVGKKAAATLSAGEPLQIEMWMRHADGRAIWSQIDAHVVDGAEGLPGTWWMVQDRSDFRQAQLELETRLEELSALNAKLEEAQNQLLQQDKMASIGQLAAGVAHEINNPIAFVSSNVHTLRQYVTGLLSLGQAHEAARANPDQVASAQLLERLQTSVDIDFLSEDVPVLLNECDDGLLRVKRIVQDLKDFSRVDHSDWQTSDLNLGLTSTLNMVRHEVKHKAEIVVKLGEVPPVTCLAGQLNQVFMNLIVNAAHAIDQRGSITLSSGHQGHWAWVQVDDTGCGMRKSVQRRIFEPFFTTKDVGKGTGLGLSLSFSIVQKHGGQIQVRSVVDEGSSFRVWVPVGGPDALAEGEQPPAWDEVPLLVCEHARG